MAHDPAADDDLPPVIGPPLAAPAASRRPPRTWRLRRVTTLLLVLLLIVTGSLQELATDYARSLVDDRVARDSLGAQLTGSAATNRTEAFTYDANGNRLTQSTGGQTTSYDYDELNRLIETSGAFVSESGYDAAGNRTSVAYGPGGVNGTDSFEYDWNNRLTAAEVDGVDVAYDYAGDDLRTERTQGTSTAPYLWDRLTALPTLAGDGASQFVHGPGGVQNEVTGSTALRPLPDGLGSARVWTDASGASVGSADYDAWGMGQASTGTTGVFGWTGEPRDPTSNLVYLRARDYSPGTGRFAQRDSVQPNAAGTNGYNPYAYANNAPTTLTDPSGHQAMAIGGGSGGFVETLTRIDISMLRLGSSRALSIRIASSFASRGAASALLWVGGLVAGNFALVALLLFVVLLLVAVMWWCNSHACTMPELPAGKVYGWIETLSVPGKTTLTMGIARIATNSCAAVLAFPAVMWGPLLIQNCGKPNQRDCLGRFLLDGLIETTINVVDPFGIGVFGTSSRGAGSKGKACDADDCKKDFQKPKKKTGSKKKDDIPSWVGEVIDNLPNVNEKPKDYADRMMRHRYPDGNYPTGARSEYSQYKKHAEADFENPKC